jgi:riboflavin biosynthesis pyrimidine reductase
MNPQPPISDAVLSAFLACRYEGCLKQAGGHINGAFLRAGLVDEVSLLVVPGIDGRTGVPAVFDGLAGRSLFPLRLKSVDQRGGTLWIRYEVIRPTASQEG